MHECEYHDALETKENGGRFQTPQLGAMLKSPEGENKAKDVSK
jgi:hypothetical protein